jgi:RNA polymerase sigma-70 factor, ECF subfamily
MLDQVFRDEWGRVLAFMIRILHDVDLAEEATQDAFTIAAERWPREGAPGNPRAWLMTTARNRAIDRLRRERTLAEKSKLLEAARVDEVVMEIDESSVPDERLELLFMCCHPSLAMDAQVALTLYAVGGLTTQEIARAFLVPAETMKRRLTRAKTKIKAAGIPFAVPAPEVLPQRLSAVLAVIYLIFNEGYGGREDLASEAIRLGRVLGQLLPQDPEVHGLLALMLLHHARRHARFSAGELVLLPDQDRSLWDETQLGQARALLDRFQSVPTPGPYLLQAAIANLQTTREVDWARVEQLYLELARTTRSPVVELNRAVAVAHIRGPEAALAIVDRLDQLDNYQYLHSTRGELLSRLGRKNEARAAYQRALELARNESEQRFLRRRLHQLQGS